MYVLVYRYIFLLEVFRFFSVDLRFKQSGKKIPVMHIMNHIILGFAISVLGGFQDVSGSSPE